MQDSVDEVCRSSLENDSLALSSPRLREISAANGKRTIKKRPWRAVSSGEKAGAISNRDSNVMDVILCLTIDTGARPRREGTLLTVRRRLIGCARAGYSSSARKQSETVDATSVSREIDASSREGRVNCDDLADNLPNHKL